LSGAAPTSPAPPGEVVLFNTDKTSAALCWTITLNHTVAFEGIEPTDLPVIVKGVTVLSADALDSPESGRLRRYIDWHYVFAQLGSIPSRATAPTNRPREL
jgi:hypothetical protein